MPNLIRLRSSTLAIRVELAAQYCALMGKVPSLNVLGGCCGTDHRHIEEICKACKN